MILLPVVRQRLNFIMATEGHRGGGEAISKPEEVPDLLVEAERVASTRSWLLSNLPWLFTGALFVFILVKVLLIARNDPPSALAIINQAGPLEVSGGVILLGLPLLASGLVVVVVSLAQGESVAHGETVRLWWVYTILVLFLSFIINWPTVILLVWFPVYFFVLSPLWKRRRKKKRSSSAADGDASEVAEPTRAADLPEPPDAVLRTLLAEIVRLEREIESLGSRDVDLTHLQQLRTTRDQLAQSYAERRTAILTKVRRPIEGVLLVLALIVFSQAAVATLNGTPWLPPERLTVSSGRPLVGYVLAEDQEWTSVLVDSDRSIRRIPSRTVTARHICSLPDTPRAITSIWDAIGGTPRQARYSKC
jgi:ABC-type multidrug transport system fused ATPase/permease subunit